MVNIDKHISELLHENDCVIVPKMGGFLNSHSSEGIHSSQISSKKLSTKLSFNVLLNHNDGLLANQLVKHEKLTYNEALEEIEKFVGEFNNELNSGKKFTIERVGILYKDERRNILIEPFEYLNEINETASVFEKGSHSIAQNEFIPGTEEQAEKTISSAFPKLHKRKFLVLKRSKVILFFVILAGSFLSYLLYIYFFQPSELNYKSPDSNAKMETEQPVDLNLSKSGKSVSDNYYIIAGSFRSIDNANRKLEELKLHGFTNAQIFTDNRQLYLVCFDRLNSLEEAQEKINSIKMQYKEAWIYNR